MDDLDYESFALGLLWGVGLVFALIHWEMRTARRPRPTPPDPFDTLRWEVLQCAREATRDAT